MSNDRRYRTSRPSSRSSEARNGYRRAAKVESGKKPKKSMTYDDYLSSFNDDKILDIDDGNLWDGVAEFVAKLKATLVAAVVKARKLSAKGMRGLYAKLPDKTAAKLNRPASKVRQRATKTTNKLGKRGTVMTVAGGFLVFVAGFLMVSANPISTGDTANEGQVKAAVDSNGSSQPDFAIVRPEDESVDAGITFDASRGVVSFRDTVQGYTVTVSQQPLTDAQKADKDTFLSEVAVNLLASGSIETNKGDAYFTTPAPEADPSQTAFFVHKDLLIFIRTQGVSLNAEVWSRYIDSLQ